MTKYTDLDTRGQRASEAAALTVTPEKAREVMQSLIDAAVGNRERTTMLLLNAAYVIERQLAAAANLAAASQAAGSNKQTEVTGTRYGNSLLYTNAEARLLDAMDGGKTK